MKNKTKGGCISNPPSREPFPIAVPLHRGTVSVREHATADGGLTVFEKGGVDVIVPGAQAKMTVAERTVIRVHEMMHAKHSPTRVKGGILEQAMQAAEDCYVHLVYWPAPGGRVMFAEELKAVLAVEKAGMASNPLPAPEDTEKYNREVLFAVRHLAIATAVDYSVRRPAIEFLHNRWGERWTKEATRIIGEIKYDSNHRKFRKLATAIERLMRQPPEEERLPDPGRDTGPITEGRARMNVQFLPMPVSTTAESRGERHTLSGLHLVGNRLTKALLGGSRRICRRVVPRKAAGTMLVDSSGSMAFTADALKRLCLAAPMATVAYYAGSGRAKGTLVIAALKGRRAVAVPQVGFGNEIDYPALKWLLAQAGPRLFVTDGRFCGPREETAAALVLFEQALRTRAITNISTVDRALEWVEKRAKGR